MISTVEFSWAGLMGGFSTLLTPQMFIMMLIGVTVGIMCGGTPGISSNMAVILFMPMTFSMDASTGLAMLLAVYTGGMSGGLISSILLDIPGTPSSIATAFDGHPMALKGEGGRALGIGILSSFVGGFISSIVLMFLSPKLANVALKFGSFEFFSIALFSLTMIGGVVGKSFVRGLAAAFLGMCLSYIGLGPLSSQPRITFGYHVLDLGIESVPLMIGSFAIPELIKHFIADKEEQYERTAFNRVRGFGIGFKEYVSHWSNILRSLFIGIGIGILPGIGGSVTNFVAYSAARSASKHPEEFGTGCVDGIIATETSNNASIGGALVTMMALGIPGSGTTALLISAIQMHGINPGPTLFLRNPDLIYAIFASLLISNIIMVIVETMGINVFAKLLDVPRGILLPIVAMMCMVGAYATGYSMFNVGCVAFFGIVGYFLQKADIPRAPLVLGYILGPIVETNLQRSLQASKMSIVPFFTRPISLVFLIVTFISTLLVVRQHKRQKAQSEG